MNFGENLKRLREQKGVSQRGLSIKSGISNGTISRLESGLSTPNSETIRKLANALNISPSMLAGWDQFEMTDDLTPQKKEESPRTAIRRDDPMYQALVKGKLLKDGEPITEELTTIVASLIQGNADFIRARQKELNQSDE